MKLRFKKFVSVDVQKVRLNELWDKSFRKWDEINVEAINPNSDGKTAHIVTYENDVLLFVPLDSFEIMNFPKD